jgi:DNA-binding MltR family transcriptional regulator
VTRQLASTACEIQRQAVSALVFERGGDFIRVYWMAILIEKLGADVERLMNIADKMRQQNQGNRFRDLTIVIFRHLAFENADAVGNHVDDVPFRAADFSVSVLLRIRHRHIRVVIPVM